MAFGLIWFFVYSQIYSQNEKYPSFRLLFDQPQALQGDALLALVIVVSPSGRAGVPPVGDDVSSNGGDAVIGTRGQPGGGDSQAPGTCTYWLHQKGRNFPFSPGPLRACAYWSE